MRMVRAGLVLVCIVFAGWLLPAQSSNEMQEKIKELEKQIAAQQAMLEELKKSIPNADETKKLMLETAQKEIAKETKKNGMADFKFSGDLRLRYEGTYYDSATTPDRNRYRMRARFGFTKQMGFGVTGIVRLATAAGRNTTGWDYSGEATSTNQTFTDAFDTKGVWLDQAYVTWTPDIAGHYFTFGGGKMANPFVSTIVVWDTDVNPEGFFQKLNFKKDAFEVFGTAGQLFLRENSKAADAYMLAYQGGVNVKMEKAGATFALAYYDYHNYEMNYKATNGNSTHLLPDGKTTILGAVDFNMVNVYGRFNYSGLKLPVEVFGDYTVNTGDQATGSHAGQDTAWSVGGTLGQNKKQRDFSIFYRYAWIESNAVVGYFADSDFGFANRKGHHFAFKYSVYDKLAVGMAFFSTNKITSPDPWNRLQLDLEYKF